MVRPAIFTPLFRSRAWAQIFWVSLAGACLLTLAIHAGTALGGSVAAQIGSDMQGENEGFPHGVPRSFDWASRPVIVMGNNSNGGRAIEAWGAVYQDAEARPTSNTRVNIRNMRTYLLEKSSGRWVLLQNTNAPMGAAYHEDFSGDLNKPADVRSEPDGTISAVAGGGFNFHFYPVTRAAIDPNNIQGIVTLFEARLIVGDPSKPDDRSTAHFLCIAGADYYPALTGSWPGNESFNPGVALGKMKYVRPDWRSFSMTTLSESQLESNPPPIDLNGILP